MRTEHGRRRAAWRGATRGLVLALALLVAMPHAALAHARLRRSDPADGSRVAAPHALRLWFSEEPELTLTTVRLTDSAGTVIEMGTPSHEGSDALAVRLSIRRLLAPGRYTVRWRTAAMDGHPSSGTFTFRVTEPATPAIALPLPVIPTPRPGVPATAAADTPTPQDAPYVLVRLVSYAALLALIGAVAFHYAVLPRVQGMHAPDAERAHRALAGGAAIAALLFLATAAIRLAMQSRMMQATPMNMAGMESMAMGTRWGGVWRTQLGAGLAALLGAALAWRGRRAGWMLAAIASILLSLGLALGGHAATVERYRRLSVLDDALHVLAASAWLGSLFWLAAIGVGTALTGDARRADHVKSLVAAFSPVALVSAGVVVATGLATSWQRLDAPSDLWTTPYGQSLFRKLVAVGLVAAIGAFNWQRVRPALGTDTASGRLKRSAWSELAAGVLVLLATAVLVATPVH